MGKTAYVYDDRCTLHEMGSLHPESPRRLIAIKEVLDGSGVGGELAHLKARPAEKEELSSIHDIHYIERIEGTKGAEGIVALDPDTSANAFTWGAACLAAGGFINCVEAVWAGKFRNSFAFVRPPGHHAERGHAMGFCFFNNVAIGAEWLIRNRKAERIAIIDFDVHHGNGTQHAFYSRGDAFFASLHHYPFYPGTGSAGEKGEGKGRGCTLNVPLSAGAGDDDYRRALEGTVLPAVEKFGPQMLLLSAGFDAHVNDPLGGMRVTTAGFRRIMRSILDIADSLCAGKVSAVLEGGYNTKALADSVEAQLEEMNS